MSGYSGTPLARKLGIKPGMSVAVLGAEQPYAELLGECPDSVVLTTRWDDSTDLVHCFETEREDLSATLSALRAGLLDTVPIWVSWPKKASKRPTSITEDVIRDCALPLGFVDVKVCAVSDVWSGLKLVVRKALRR